jgi:HEAT repeat protein
MRPAVNDLIRDLANPDEGVRGGAAAALAGRTDPAAVPARVAALGDPSGAVRGAVVAALAVVGGTGTAAAVARVLGSEDPPTRNAACQALYHIGLAAVGPLSDAVAAGPRDVRLFALDVLALIAGHGAGAVIAAAARDPDPNVAAAAVTALGNVGGPEVVPALTAALADDPWVRCAVATSLGRIGGAEATAALAGLLADADETVAYTAAQALGACGRADAVAPLAVAAGHPEPMVAGAALDALDRVTDRLTPLAAARLRERVSFDPVFALLSADDRAVQYQALCVLGRVGGGDAARAEVNRLAARAVGAQRGDG